GNKNIPENKPIDAVAVTTIDTVYVGILNIDKFNKGCSWVCSYFTKIINSTKPTTISPIDVEESSNARVELRPNAYKTAPIPVVIRINPMTSNLSVSS